MKYGSEQHETKATRAKEFSTASLTAAKEGTMSFDLTANEKLEQAAKLAKSLTATVESAEAVLAEWTCTFEAGAAYAFTWSERAMEAAARQKTVGYAADLLNRILADTEPASDERKAECDDPVAVIGKLAYRSVLDARSIPCSTSAMSNLMEALETDAWKLVLKAATRCGFAAPAQY